MKRVAVSVILVLMMLVFVSYGQPPKKHSFLESDYLKKIKNEYQKQKYKAVMLDDGVPEYKEQNEIVDFAIGIIISNIDKDFYLRHFLFAKRIFLYNPDIAYNKSKEIVRKVKGIN